MSSEAHVSIRTIHHFEDEPELVRWIPGSLLNLYWRRHPEWVANDGRYLEQDPQLTTFELNIGARRWQIEYRLYHDPEEFEEKLKEHAKPGDVALIDLMDAKQLPVGRKAFEIATAMLGEASVYFFTAFPKDMPADMKTDRVLPKPIDVTELVGLLAEKLAIE